MPTPFSVLWSLAPFRLVGARRAALVATAAALGLTACGGDDDGPTGGGSGIPGTYIIRSLDGPAGLDQAAPFTLFEGVIEGSTIKAEILSGSLTLASGGTYTGTQVVQFTIDGEVSDFFSGTNNDAGTYSVSGTTITLIANDDPEDPDDNDVADRTTTGTISGGAITVSEEVDTDGDGVNDDTFTIVARKS